MLHAGRFPKPYNTCWTIPPTCWRCMPSILEGTEKLFHLLAELRQRHYETPICLYGFFPTLAWQDILDEYPTVDYVIVGEPEDTLVRSGPGAENRSRRPGQGSGLENSG